MDKPIHKRLFSEAYSSEEEIADIDWLQKEFDSENIMSEGKFDSESTILEFFEPENAAASSTDSEDDDEVDGKGEGDELDDGDKLDENYTTFGLKLGDTFEDWDLAEKQVESHAMEAGFEVVT